MQLFVDGSEDNIVSTFFTGDFSGNSPVYIGYYINGYHYSGWLDEIAIYKVALTKTQIENHYKNGLAGKSYCDQFTTDIKSTSDATIEYIRWSKIIQIHLIQLQISIFQFQIQEM